MAQPKTLMQMAGLEPRPHRLAGSAVIMIDAQNEYRSGALALPGVEAALAEGARLLAAAREAGALVIHVQHRGRPGGLFDPETAAFAIAEPVAPLPGEIVVVKGLPNAFAGTELQERLREREVGALIVAGFMTHMCVSSTVRAALDHGYACTLVASACATRDLPDGSGGVVAAAALQRAELAALADRFAVVAADTAALTG